MQGLENVATVSSPPFWGAVSDMPHGQWQALSSYPRRTSEEGKSPIGGYEHLQGHTGETWQPQDLWLSDPRAAVLNLPPYCRGWAGE